MKTILKNQAFFLAGFLHCVYNSGEKKKKEYITYITYE